ncbi:bifunctional 5,10-methylenetetrahydrofolate dehydrogenase/5,10-methenyltetrahydrofolate cyclohydrolase [Candidatus Margulisiibacteriota bacterium]
MSAKIIDGRAIAKKIREDLKEEVSKMEVKPGLAVVLVGENPASVTYVNMKKRACEEIGIHSFMHELAIDISEQELLALVDKLNKDPKVSGILVQLPLPDHIDPEKIMLAVDPVKDVDGFHPMTKYVSCTPGGIMELINSTGVEISGKKAVVIGRSHIVGKPVASLLLAKNATVTICHSRTKDLAAEAKMADILIVAIGRAKLVTADMIKPGAIVIDVGTNRVDNKLCGDVDYEPSTAVAGHITPVPGGVGPMTIAILMRSTVAAAKNFNKS